MGHVEDKWTKPNPVAGVKPKRIRTERWGRGKRWLARWEDAGGTPHSQACATKDEATAKIAAMEVSRRVGGFTDTGITVAEWLPVWLARRTRMRDNTREQVDRRLRLHVIPALGSLRLTAVRPGNVQDMISGLAATHSPASVEVIVKHLNSAMRAAIADRILEFNPCDEVELPEIVQSKVIPLTITEVAEIKGAMWPWLAHAVTVASGTGLRPGELRALTWDRVKLTGAKPHVIVDRQISKANRSEGVTLWGPPKTRRSNRVVTIAPVTVQAFEQHRASTKQGLSDLVFTNSRGTPLTRASMSNAWVAAVGCDPTGDSWHQLRHFHASLLIAKGMSPRVVADRLGHSSPMETLKTYSHLWEDDDSRARGIVQDALGEAL